MMSEVSSLDELLTLQKKEKKELTAKTQKMKHGVPKGDKKKKKEVTAEIAQLLADLEIKQEKEIKEFENKICSTVCVNSAAEEPESNIEEIELSTENMTNESECVNCDTEKNDEEPSNKGVQRITKAQKKKE